VRGEDDIAPREEKLRTAENERFHPSRGTQINCAVSDDDGVSVKRDLINSLKRPTIIGIPVRSAMMME